MAALPDIKKEDAPLTENEKQMLSNFLNFARLEDLDNFCALHYEGEYPEKKSKDINDVFVDFVANFPKTRSGEYLYVYLNHL